ncbi:MAG: molybdate ABC transporter permease subunit [bacterium]|nr:molybdate ABC transporter permease subunit [bacterium]
MESWSEALIPLWLSLKIAGLATLLTVVPGTLCGLVLARRSFPGKAIVETIVELPLVLPPTAVGLALLSLLGRHGPLGRESLGFDLHLIFTWKGAVLASAVMSFPLVARTARVAFEGVDPRLEWMAASLGMSRMRVKWAVTLPLAARGLTAATLLGFSRALGEFGATALVAGNIPGRTQTLAIAIFDDIQNGRNERAMILLAIAVVLAFAAVSTVGWLHRKDQRLRSKT